MMKPMRGVAPQGELRAFPYYASPKIDGIRAVVRDGRVLSKTMKPIPNGEIQRRFGPLHGFDGELTVGPAYRRHEGDDVYDRSRGLIMSAQGDPQADYRFNAFDLWDQPALSASARLGRLRGILLDVPGLHRVKQVVVATADELAAYEQRVLAQGFEGVMLRRADGIYKYGTATEKEGYLLKIKRFKEAEAFVVGFGEQMENTNPLETKEDGSQKRSAAKAGKVGKGTLGYFVVKDATTGKTFEIGGGPGVTDAFRKTVWSNQGLYRGRMLRYRFQEIGTKDLPRLPQFAGWRDEIDYEPRAVG